MNKPAQLDHQYIWHPFTQMRDWLKSEPIIITSGKGAVLRDVHGREYLDANASIWTNLHGHNHPKLNAAIRNQLKKIAHSSALGLANEPAALLAEKLVRAANPKFLFRSQERSRTRAKAGATPGSNLSPAGSSSWSQRLNKIFYSDDGSTAMEVALKLAYEYARRTGRTRNPKFLSLQGAYHGDTIGAVSLGHIDLFRQAYAGLLFKSDRVMAPYCYRCRFNRAQPERADARLYRKCNWECIGKVEQKFAQQSKKGNPYAAMVVEPLIQGAAGMIPQPSGWLHRVMAISRAYGAQLIADEVMTGFGRTGAGVAPPAACAFFSANEQTPVIRKRSKTRPDASQLEPEDSRGRYASLFACHREGVQPDFMALAKGLTGGYLPMAATLTSQPVFDAFLGHYSEFKTFFHGHSYTANQLGSAAALASLDLLQAPVSLSARQRLEQTLGDDLESLWALPQVGDIRQVGLMAGIELVKNWRTREPFDRRERAGIRVCEAMARHRVLTRPIGNVIVLMPPFCTTPSQVGRIIDSLIQAIQETFC